MAHIGQYLFSCFAGQQVEHKGGAAAGGNLVPQQVGCGVNQTAFDPSGGGHKLTFACEMVTLRISEADSHRLEGLACKFTGKKWRPGRHVKAAIRRHQRRNANAALSQHGHPSPVRPQARPTAATQGQHHGIGLKSHLFAWCVEPQSAICGPAQPAVPHAKLHTRRPQAVQPGPQQWRGFHVSWEHPARAAHKGLDAQSKRPVAQLLRTKVSQHRLQLGTSVAVSADKGFKVFSVRQVQTAFACQ